ncbi:MAG: molybdopterin cofactor-binding domain-containing protein [Planctomycetaceae bacterium]
MAIVVNGVERDLASEPERSLLSALRDELGLTGAKYGCGEGECGACTVLVDGEPVRSCRYLLADADGRAVTTVEGIAEGGTLHPVQRAFLEVGAMQCGFCTAGFVVAATALLRSSPDPDDAEIRAGLQDNVCRCCTYPRILRAVHRAAELAREPGRVMFVQGREADPTAPLEPPDAPWDLREPLERDWFSVLGDGLVVVAPPVRDRWSTSAGAWIHVGVDGVVTAFTGKVDVGQDNRTALSQLLAEELRVPIGSVRLVMGDTDVCPFDMGTFGSRSTPDAGPALRTAAAAARELAWEVAPGVRRVEVVAGEPALTAASRWTVAGRPAPRIDALGVVTGSRRYPSDVSLPGAWVGRVVRPPVAGASLRSVDLEAARAIADVTVVHEGDFIGVAAPDAATARAAMGSIGATWDVASGPGEDELVAHLRSHPVQAEGWGGAEREEVGDVDRALAEAEVALAETYTTAYLAHVPLEPRAALAQWREDRVTVWTGTQRPFGVRHELAEALGVEETRVRVIVPPTGGGFGGKHTGQAAIEAARLARAAGRPVRVRWTREEEFRFGYVRPAAVIDVRSGADADGALTAWSFTNVNAGSAGIDTPYEVPNRRAEFVPADSPLRQGSYRALAATANHFARESHLDELAHRLEADALALRLRHLEDERLAAVLRAAAERAGWDGRRGRPGRGIGIACGVEKDAYVATCAEVLVDDEGRLEVVRIVTAFDCGAIVNPDNLTNQIEGATVMGLGGALFEAVHLEHGAIANPRLSEYRVPRMSDVPAIDVVLLDRPEIEPAGAGETPIVAVAPALANAIFAASGVRLRSMPLAPDGAVR